jgi:MFS family permease
LVGAFLTRVPVSTTTLAMLLFLRAQTHSFATGGAVVGAYALALAVAAPVQGVAVDRYGQTKILTLCAAGQAVAIPAFVLVASNGASPVALVLVAGIAGALLPPTTPCVRALWRELARDEQALHAAYAVDAVTFELAWAIAPLLVAGVSAAASPAAAVLICPALMVVGITIFATSASSRAWRGEARQKVFGGALANRELRWLTSSAALIGCWWGMVLVGVPAVALSAGLRHSSALLMAVLSVGSVVGGAVLGTRPYRTTAIARYSSSLFALGLSLIPLAMARGTLALVPLCFLAGIALTPALSSQNALVGMIAPAGSVTEAYQWLTAAMSSGAAAGATAAGALIDATGVSSAFVAGAIAALAAAFLASARGPLRALSQRPRSAASLSAPNVQHRS